MLPSSAKDLRFKKTQEECERQIRVSSVVYLAIWMLRFASFALLTKFVLHACGKPAYVVL